MTLEDLLPPDLRGPNTTITPIAAGLSGAGVHRVDAAGQAFVLKVAAESESAEDWRSTLHIQRLAADAGLAPRVIHVDEPRRAVLTEFVADRSFAAFYRDPQTHEAALTLLGRTVRRIHALPIPGVAPMRDPREFLTQLWNQVLSGFPLPGFIARAVERVLAEAPPIREGALVLGHNDLNPSNFVYDGEAILVLDWAAAGPMDAYYDLAVIAVFLRMDGGTCLRLLSAYEGKPIAELPKRFLYMRRLAAALAGAMQLFLACQMNHAGATGAETPESTLSLGEFYQRMMTGALKLGTAEGQWAFGLALLKECLAL
ncbi:phosphotransferase [Polyangium jinanense]|uniref:Phosphotransferase n=1 Tax=Polyangium jinanense TaxID=2829994 RepID=A0A9X3X2S4_9BACT|nr:phosphotransferase [Polyangium jinanense]MDC3954779.1 phosphotransferase [Polyangium jinanense]MDC3981450.1 phosphotransferase [Polyangium jinanense]